MDRTDEERRRALREANWEDVAVRLTGYALWKLRNLQWRVGSGEFFPSDKVAEDLAGEAILKVLDGHRSWDPRRGPLLPYLRGVVDSLLSHLSESRERRSAILRPDMDSFATASPLTRHEDDRVLHLRAALVRAGERALTEIVDAVLTDTEATPRDLAHFLGTSVADINNRLKRLRRFAQREESASKVGSGAK